MQGRLRREAPRTRSGKPAHAAQSMASIDGMTGLERGLTSPSAHVRLPIAAYYVEAPGLRGLPAPRSPYRSRPLTNGSGNRLLALTDAQNVRTHAATDMWSAKTRPRSPHAASVAQLQAYDCIRHRAVRISTERVFLCGVQRSLGWRALSLRGGRPPGTRVRASLGGCALQARLHSRQPLCVVRASRADVPERLIGDRERIARLGIGQPRSQVSVATSTVVHTTRVESAESRRDGQTLPRPVSVHDTVSMPASGPEFMPGFERRAVLVRWIHRPRTRRRHAAAARQARHDIAVGILLRREELPKRARIRV